MATPVFTPRALTGIEIKCKSHANSGPETRNQPDPDLLLHSVFTDHPNLFGLHSLFDQLILPGGRRHHIAALHRGAPDLREEYSSPYLMNIR